MKQVTIFQKNCSPVIVEDSDESSIEDYSKRISQLLENNNISILHTSTCSVIVRPDKISSIHVCDVCSKTNKDLDIHQKQLKESTEEKSNEDSEEEFEGTITD